MLANGYSFETIGFKSSTKTNRIVSEIEIELKVYYGQVRCVALNNYKVKATRNTYINSSSYNNKRP